MLTRYFFLRRVGRGGIEDMNTMKTGAIVCAAALLVNAVAGPASAGGYWNNGPVASDSGCCDNSPSATTTTGCGAGYTVYDDFTSRTDRSINTITYDSYPTGAEGATKVSLFDHDPITTDATDPFLTFVQVGTTSADAFGATLVTLFGLSISLAAGTYWIGLQNIFADGSVSSFGVSSQSHLQGAEQGRDSGPVYRLPSRVDAAFTLQSDVPEPATWAMLILGFGLSGACIRRREHRLATFGRSPNRATM